MALALDSLILQGVERVVTQFELKNKVTLEVWLVAENRQVVLKARVLEAPKSEPIILQTSSPQNLNTSEFLQAVPVLYRNGTVINNTKFIISIRCFTYDPEQCPKPGFLEELGNFSRTKTGKIITYTAIGLGAVAAAVPIGLFAVGFGAGGVAAGSIAAGVQASIGNVAAGSFFALCQSLGATGAATAGLWGLTTPALLIPRAFGGSSDDSDAEKKRLQNEIENAVKKLSRKDILQILKSDEFPNEEIVLFQAVYCWAKLQCKECKECTQSSHIQLVLGQEIINLIRFPTMSPIHFNEIVVPTQILTDEEVAQIRQYFQQTESTNNLASSPIPSLKFNSQRRWQGIRLFKGSQDQGMPFPTSEQKIILSTSHPMKIESLGFLGPLSKDSEYSVEIHIGTSPELQNMGSITVPARQKQIVQVNLPNPLITQPFEEYIIKYKIITIGVEGNEVQIQRPEPLTINQDSLKPQLSYTCVGKSGNGILAEISCRSLEANGYSSSL